MAPPADIADRGEPIDLERFTVAQAGIYEQALAELQGGQKRSHWMWYVFPQFDGLGHSSKSKHYAIKSLDEGREYLKHPTLGPRLLECTAAVLAHEGRLISRIFGYPDDLKFQSSMTLFAAATDQPAAFVRALDMFFQGERDARTLELIRQSHEPGE